MALGLLAEPCAGTGHRDAQRDFLDFAVGPEGVLEEGSVGAAGAAGGE